MRILRPAGCIVALLVATVAGTQDHPVPVLNLGDRIQTTVAPGAPKQYALEVQAGQYLSILAEDASSALNFVLTASDGAKIRECQGMGPGRPTQLNLVTAAAGRLTLEIRNTWDEVPSVSCDFQVEALHSASERDLKLVEARRMYEAGNAAEDGDEAGWRDAIAKFLAAADLYRAAGDAADETVSLRSAGAGHLQIGEVLEDIALQQKALAVARAAGNRRQELITLKVLGVAYFRLGKYEERITNLMECLEIGRAMGDRGTEADVFATLASVYRATGEHRNAIYYLESALSILRDLGAPIPVINTRLYLAEEYALAGETSRAIDEYSRLAREAHDQVFSPQGVIEAEALRRGAGVLADTGEYSKALDWYRKALALYPENRRGQALVLGGIASVYARLKDSAKAVENADEALETMPNNPNPSDFMTIFFLKDVGLAYSRAGEKDKALACFNRGMAQARAVSHAEFESQFLALIASVELNLGKLQEANDHIQEALLKRQATRGGLHGPDQRSSYFSTFRSCYDLYVRILLALDSRDRQPAYGNAAFEASENARARSLLDLLNESRISLPKGIDRGLLEEERKLRERLSATEIRRTSLLRRKQPADLTEPVARELQRLSTEYETLEARIRTTSPAYASLAQPQPLRLKEVQQDVLDADTVLLEFMLSEEGSHLWAVSRTSIEHFELAAKPEIEHLARQAYEGWTRPGAPQGAAKDLGHMLLVKARGALGKHRILVVADGALQYVPFAALPDPAHPGHHLGSEHEVVYAPSASVISVLRKEPRSRNADSRRVAVVADPVFEKDDPRLQPVPKRSEPSSDRVARDRDLEWSLAASGVSSERGYVSRLPFSRREADAILSVSSPDRVMEALDFRASRATALSPEFARYRILHFATHGILNDEMPGLSSLVLSLFDEKGRAQNGYLRLNDIYNMELGSDLVVLSACRTALGRSMNGEGMIGLTRGFMYAGAKSVVASLWKVDDLATSQLMSRFYEGMFRKSLSPAAALRAAQLDLSQTPRWHDPYYWAGFILQGDWKDPISSH